jgi:hypothetical protein
MPACSCVGQRILIVPDGPAADRFVRAADDATPAKTANKTTRATMLLRGALRLGRMDRLLFLEALPRRAEVWVTFVIPCGAGTVFTYAFNVNRVAM